MNHPSNENKREGTRKIKSSDMRYEKGAQRGEREIRSHKGAREDQQIWTFGENFRTTPLTLLSYE